MKKFLIVFIAFLLFSSCKNARKSDKIYTITYIVFYPGQPTTYKVSNDTGFYLGSTNGTNFIAQKGYSGRYIYQGTSPTKVIKYTIKDKPKNEKKES